jgi:hypothetical protein
VTRRKSGQTRWEGEAGRVSEVRRDLDGGRGVRHPRGGCGGRRVRGSAGSARAGERRRRACGRGAGGRETN